MPSSNLVRRSRRTHKQTRLTLDSAEPNYSGGLTPARVRYEGSACSRNKIFNLHSQYQVQLGDNDESFPSGKNFAVVIESPPKPSKLHSQPLSSPFTSVKAQNQVSDNSDSAINVEEQNQVSDDSDYDINVEAQSQMSDDSDYDIKAKAQSRVRDDSDYDINHLPSHTSIRCGSSSSVYQAKKHKTRRAFAYDGADSSDGSLPEKHMRSTPTKTTKKSTLILLSDSSDDSLHQAPLRVRAKGGKAIITPEKNNATIGEGPQKTPAAQSFLKDGRSSAPVTPKSKSKSVTPSQHRKKSGKTRLVLSGHDSSDEYVVSSTPRRPQGSSKILSRASTSDDDNDDDFPDIAHIKTPSKGNRRSSLPAVNAPSDDEEEEPIFSPLKRRRPLIDMKGSKDEDSDEPSPSKRSNLGRHEQVHSDDEKVGQRKRKDKGKAREMDYQPRRITRQEQRRYKKTHRSAQQKAIELAKRRRAGEKISEITDSDSSEDTVQRGIYDRDSDLQALSEFEDESEDGIDAVRQSLKVKNRNENDDGFVVADDDDEPLGVPTMGLHDIPLQFTHAAHKPLKEHFKDAVEWIVQKKINPLFNKNDPLYDQAFKKLDDEVHGYASSKFSSSSWTPEFVRALWARPGYWDGLIGAAEVESAGVNKCEACNRSHKLTWTIQFTGKAYYKLTLEEVDNDHSTSDEDENSDDDAEGDSSSSGDGSVNSKGEPIPEETKVWHVGRFCRANAEIAHRLIHWKYALNSWVLDKLAEEQHLEPEKVVQREDWTSRRRGKYANRIVDKWETEGILGGLWGEFKTNLQKAREHKQTRY